MKTHVIAGYNIPETVVCNVCKKEIKVEYEVRCGLKVASNIRTFIWKCEDEPMISCLNSKCIEQRGMRFSNIVSKKVKSIVIRAEWTDDEGITRELDACNINNNICSDEFKEDIKKDYNIDFDKLVDGVKFLKQE